MNAVNGRVVVKETGAGVPGLVVAAFAASAEEDQVRVVGRYRRLGSAITGDGGRFGFDYELPAGVRQDWDIVVNINAPDDGDIDESNLPLASSRRSDPASRESFQIRIATAKLVEAGVIAAPAEPDPHKIIERAAADRRFQAVLQAERRRLLAERISVADETRRATEIHFGRFLKSLSDADGRRPGSRYVPPGGSIRQAGLAAMRDGITGHVNQIGLETVGVFTAEQLASLRQRHGADLSRVPAAAIESMLWPQRPVRPSALFRLDPTWWCRRQVPVNDCVKILDPDSEGHDHDEPAEEPTPEVDGGQPTAEPVPVTVPDLIARMTATMTSPEEKVLFGVRPGVGDIQGNVDGFSLRSGPADVPATYDFHRLEIAFESVWEELFDQGAIDTGQQLYEEFVELGLDPNEYLIGPDEKFILNFKLKPSNPGATGETLPPAVTEAFEITQREWEALDHPHHERLAGLATELNDPEKMKTPYDDVITMFESLKVNIPQVPVDGVLEQLRRLRNEAIDRVANEVRAKGARIIKYAREKLQAPRDFDQFHTLLEQLGKQLKEPYRFNVYAAGRRERSINFGVVVTYRQKWTPVTYQVGELVRTIPLAPKEVRKYTRKVLRKLSRAEKEARSSLESLRTESSVTSRVEGEIIAKAMNKTNFQVGADAGINIGIANASGSTKFSQDAEQSSQDTKKEFRESVFKAAAEYKSEHKLEVDVSESAEFSDEESGEISNPNDELPVTFLFYELQRRYRVEETLKKVTPIILVAQEFPHPHEIDEDWIVAHDWILRRVILDDSFVPAMNYLASKVVGDEHALNEMFENLQQQRRILDKLTDELVVLRSQVSSRYEALQHSMKRRADANEAENNEGFFEEGISSLFGGDSPDPEAMKAREDAARDAYQRLLGQERDLTGRLERETTAVAELTDKYTKQLSDHLNRRTQISRLRVHIKANIFHYMQAIYSFEPTDQRYFRLHDVQVPRLKGAKAYSIVTDPDAIPLPPTWTRPHKLEAHVQIDPDNLEYDSLGDIADLDNLLGFKGNYMMFPLKQENALTDFMMTPYYDPFTGLRDPDQLANWTMHEFAEYVCCLKEHSSQPKFESYLPGLIETYRRLKERLNDDDELVVPTGSLYIEALPGANPILEDFKLAHRAIDVKKVQAEVRGVEMENVRMAARLLAGEREDPTIEKKIVIAGDAETIVLPDET